MDIRERKPHTPELYDENGDIIELPTHKVVCPCCRGEGTVVNPGIDSHGISQETFDEDPEFEEAYFSGVYDIMCPWCDGKNVIDEVNVDALSPELRKEYEEDLDNYYDMLAEEEAEKRFYY